jgi:magnesium chelatase family protein
VEILKAMSFAKLFSVAGLGTRTCLVAVEVHVSAGLPSFSIVGLPDTEVKESRHRVRSAIQNSGFEFPARRIVVNLAPADLPKNSGGYDLPIALGILLAMGVIDGNNPYLQNHVFVGELALNGSMRYTNGLLTTILGLEHQNLTIILPQDNLADLDFLVDKSVLGGSHLTDVILYLSGKLNLPSCSFTKGDVLNKVDEFINFCDIKGHVFPKKALEIAAAGRHSLLMYGVPGCGKSMLAKSILSILPVLTYQESLKVASIYSNSSVGFDKNNWQKVPFRNPHHKISVAAMIGGSSSLKSGEISLAHHGILFLDELPEFSKDVIEALREPLENKYISLSRVKFKVQFDADFQLIAAMNPCPCGNYGSNLHYCSCTKSQIMRYNSKISQPIRDRLDIIVPVQTLNSLEFLDQSTQEPSCQVASRVLMARNLQFNRQGKLNYLLSNVELDRYCVMTDDAKELSLRLMQHNKLSVRGYYRMLKLALTIKDLEGIVDAPLSKHHVSLASFYRSNIIAKDHYE